MLDTDVPRIRVDRLKKYIEEQKSKCERQREQSLKAGDEFEYHAECGKIEAYNDILVILDKRAQRYENSNEDSWRGQRTVDNTQ